MERALGTGASNLAIPKQYLAVSIDRQQERVARRQAAENRAYEPNLAMALNNLAIRLAETGDRAGAIAPAKEAVVVLRRLVATEPHRKDDLDKAVEVLRQIREGADDEPE